MAEMFSQEELDAQFAGFSDYPASEEADQCSSALEGDDQRRSQLECQTADAEFPSTDQVGVLTRVDIKRSADEVLERSPVKKVKVHGEEAQGTEETGGETEGVGKPALDTSAGDVSTNATETDKGCSAEEKLKLSEGVSKTSGRNEMEECQPSEIKAGNGSGIGKHRRVGELDDARMMQRYTSDDDGEGEETRCQDAGDHAEDEEHIESRKRRGSNVSSHADHGTSSLPSFQCDEEANDAQTSSAKETQASPKERSVSGHVTSPKAPMLSSEALLSSNAPKSTFKISQEGVTKTGGGVTSQDRLQASKDGIEGQTKSAKELEGDCERLKAEMAEIRKELAKSEHELKDTKTDLAMVTDERDDFRYETMQLRAEDNNRKAKAKEKAVQLTTTTKEIIKKTEEDLKKKNDKKLTDAKEKADAKYEDLRSRANKMIHEKKAKWEEQLEEAKDSVTSMKEERKREKQECAELKKTLKKQQQEEIKKHKPETSAVVKEKDEMLKEKGKEIRKLQDATLGLKDKIDFLEQSNAAADKKQHELETLIEKYKAERYRLQDEVKKSGEEVDRMIKDGIGMKDDYEHELDQANQRFQLQSQKADRHARDADDIRRGLFTLRSGEERKDREIAGLHGQINELKAVISDLKKRTESVDGK